MTIVQLTIVIAVFKWLQATWQCLNEETVACIVLQLKPVIFNYTPHVRFLFSTAWYTGLSDMYRYVYFKTCNYPIMIHILSLCNFQLIKWCPYLGKSLYLDIYLYLPKSPTDSPRKYRNTKQGTLPLISQGRSPTF